MARFLFFQFSLSCLGSKKGGSDALSSNKVKIFFVLLLFLLEIFSRPRLVLTASPLLAQNLNWDLERRLLSCSSMLRFLSKDRYGSHKQVFFTFCFVFVFQLQNFY